MLVNDASFANETQRRTSMAIPMFFLQPHVLILIVAVTFFTLLFLTLLYLYLNIHRIRQKRQFNAAIAEKRDAYARSISAPEIKSKQNPTRFALSLEKLPNPTTFDNKTICETKSEHANSPVPSNYKTFDFAKRYQRHLSSDSSYTSSNIRRTQPISFSFDTVKSKFQQVQRRSTPSPTSYRQLEAIQSEKKSAILSSDSDDDDIDSQSIQTSTATTFEYSLADLFRVEIVYKLFYSIDDRQLLFQLIRLNSMQPLIERCFPSLICKVRLFTNNGKRKDRKYFSKKDPTNEIFKFDLDQYTLDQSYLKIQLFGQQKNEKRLELGHVILVLNQYENLMIRSQYHHDNGLTDSEQHVKSIPIDEDRIDMITQHQALSEDETRALICLVYENDRCLLHVGLIKIIGIQSLFKLHKDHYQRDAIQIKILTTIDGKIIAKKKSKPIPMEKNLFTFSTSFHFDYLSLHKTSVCIQLYHRRSSIRSSNKFMSSIEFGSTELKNQQSFQHWTDTLSAPNRPHIHWHTLSPNLNNKEK